MLNNPRTYCRPSRVGWGVGKERDIKASLRFLIVMSESRGRALVKLGVLEQRYGPTRIVTFVRTYRHPTKALSVTIAPSPSASTAAYWNKYMYDSWQNYDRIVFEDGRPAVCAGTVRAAITLTWRRVFPMLLHKAVVPHHAMSKYVGSLSRDLVESKIAYESCVRQLMPPVDPRARRAFEYIETLGNQLGETDVGKPPNSSKASEAPPPAGMRVLLPWNVYHVAYLRHRLEVSGFVLESTVEETVFVPLVFVWNLAFYLVVGAVLLYYTIKAVFFGL